MWTWHIDKGLSQEQQGQYSKHIYLGETRIVTKQTSKLEASYGQSDEWHHRYYYHSDHLGSAQLITDYEGNEYQRIEYTPYGELWVEKKTAHEKGMRYLPYKFTAKEMDEETGLYYYGARYLDAKYSRWMSADPAVGEYIPMAPVDDEAKKHNQQLPGQGGVFNVVNFQLYHYAGNNPVKYVDPDGRFLTRQFLAGLSQLTSGILEEVGAAGISAGTVGVGTGVGVFLGLDGIYNISDGFAKALSACFDIEYGGIINTVTTEILITAGVDKEIAELVGTSLDVVHDIIDLVVAPGKKDVSQIIKKIDLVRKFFVANNVVNGLNTLNDALVLVSDKILALRTSLDENE